MVLITRKNGGGGGGGGSVTPSSTDTFTNKTLDDYTNFIHADGIHLRVKATELLVKGDVIKFVGFNAGEQAIEVAKRDNINVPAIGVIYTASMATGDFGMAVSNGLFKGINTSSFIVGTILYPNASGGFTATNPGGYAQQLAYVVRSHAVNGEIMINVGPVYGLDKRGLTGNAGTNPSTNFIGTTDAQPLVVRTNNVERMRINNDGNVGIGTTSPQNRLHMVDSDTTYMKFGAGLLDFGFGSSKRLEIQQNAVGFGAGVGANGAGAIRINGSGGNAHISANTTSLVLNGSGGNVSVNSINALSSLDVNGSFALPIRTSSVNTTLTASDFTVVLTTAARTVTLPSPVLDRIYTVSNRSNGNCFITGDIDGSVQTITIPAYESYQLQSTSTTWYIKSSNSAKLYVQSRGLNLVTNGTGLLGTNENFSSLIYDPVEVFSGRASFRSTTNNQTFVSNELIPVDINKKYRLSLYAKSTTYVAGNKAFFGIQPTDIDGLLVSPQNYKRFSGTDTTLASELKAGDTTITLTSASGWQTSNAQAYNRQAIFWNYSNSQGYQYPVYTYSRNNTALNYGGTYSSAGLWAVGGISGNVITLTSPWTGATIPAGTAVSNASSAGIYKYIAASDLEIPNTWTKFSGCIQGVDELGLASNAQFPYGTAFVQIIALMNRQVSGNVTNISNISFQEDVDNGDIRLIPSQTGTHYVDFLNDNYVDMTLTGNTTILKGVTPNKNITEVVKYIIRGNFTLSFGSEFTATYPITGTYNGTKDNLIIITCMNINGALKYKVNIEN